jgi:probable rRNA maturation factor
MKVRFNYADANFDNKISRTNLKELVSNIFKKEKVALEFIDYIFCSDEYLLGINQSALNHDYYTDIITFPLHDKGKPVNAEIYISIERVRENAQTHNTTFKHELARVIAHGSLHLCGYKDKSKKEIAKMRERENWFIQTILS